MIKIFSFFLILGGILNDTSVACPDNEYCVSCVDDNKTCDACQDSFPTGVGKCQVPETTKDHCIGYADKDTCGICEWGYYLKDGSCIANTIDKCMIESVEGSTHTCVGCEGGYASEDNACPDKTLCTGNCNYCVLVLSIQICVLCDDGYTQHGSTCKESTGSLEHCWITDDGSNCNTCIGGYYDHDGTCKESSKTGSISSSGVYSLMFISLFSFVFSF